MSTDHGKLLALAERVAGLAHMTLGKESREEREAIERELRALAQPAEAVEGREPVVWRVPTKYGVGYSFASEEVMRELCGDDVAQGAVASDWKWWDGTGWAYGNRPPAGRHDARPLYPRAAPAQGDGEWPFDPAWPHGLEAGGSYKVLCDDKGRNGGSWLSVYVAVDGDAHVCMQDWENVPEGEPSAFPSIRCRNYFGGGRNARVHQALLWLAQAIRLDCAAAPSQEPRS